MKILFSTDQVYLHGGIEKVMAEKANYFVREFGFEVFILTSEQKNFPACYPLDKAIKLIDIGIEYERESSYLSWVNVKKIYKHYRKLNAQLAKIKPDVVISVNYAFDFYWLPFVFRKIPKFKEFHSSRYFVHAARENSRSFIKKIKYKLDDYIESKFDKLVLLNKDEMPFYHSQNLIVIPNPITPIAMQATLQNKKAIAAGRIAPVKGFENLIDAWSKVSLSHPDWILEIYGQDYLDSQRKLQEQINRLGLRDKIIFAGTSNAMRETMSDYSMYLMTSQTECFPMVLLESLSIGLPIVSFDSPTGPRNIITSEEDGFLVEYNNNDALAQKIIFLMSDEQQRKEFGLKAKMNSRRFSPEIVMQQWKDLLLATIKTP